jgi:DNA mismatch endonuclease (patch repair protein)
MQAVKSKDTAPEMLVRHLLYALGIRYRLHRRELPGCPDLVFFGKRKVIFIHGCFWHGHHCSRGSRTPKTNAEYWTTKIDRNRKRDAETVQQLQNTGWSVLVIWECQIRESDLPRRLVEFLQD